jgi:hypothetical protein
MGEDDTPSISAAAAQLLPEPDGRLLWIWVCESMRSKKIVAHVVATLRAPWAKCTLLY